MNAHRLTTAGLFTVAILFLVAPRPSGSADESLRDWFSEEEITQTSLSRLTESERKLLVDWLKAYAIKPNSAVQISKNSGRATVLEEAEEASADKFSGKIVGEVRGWSGNARFVLDNGQVWRQRGSQVSNRTYVAPDVIVSRNLFGFWEMQILPSGDTVRVVRER